mgnify:CR=1 FL=1
MANFYPPKRYDIYVYIILGATSVALLTDNVLDYLIENLVSTLRSNPTGKNIIKFKYCMYVLFCIVPKNITHFHLYMRKVVLMIYPFHDHCSTRQLLCCRMFYMCYIFLVSTYATNMRKIITHFWELSFLFPGLFFLIYLHRVLNLTWYFLWKFSTEIRFACVEWKV